MPEPLESAYQKYQRQLVPYAYNIIGDSMAAEDVVQEILNMYFLNSSDHIQNPDGYLVRSVINRSINAKKSIQVRNKSYIGQWLPVPIYTDENIYRDLDKSRILDYSLLVLLERLNPKERAVFILKESFDFEHSEIAETIDTSVENSRQLYKRARQKLEPGAAHTGSKNIAANPTIKKLTDAILHGDLDKVKQLLSIDAQSHSDGGDMRAAPKIIIGRENVSKFLKAIYGKYFHDGTVTHLTELNHAPAVIFKLGNIIYRCLIFDIREGEIENLYIIVNPAKLRGLTKTNLIM